MAQTRELLIKSEETESEVRARLGVVGRDDIHISHVGHHYDGSNVLYVFSEEELFSFKTEEFLLNFFAAYCSSPSDDDETKFHHAHEDGVFFSWWKPVGDDRYLCILFSEGLDGVDCVEVALSQRWPEPSGGLIIDTMWNDVHFVRFNMIDMVLPEVFLTLEAQYDPRDGYRTYRHYLPTVKKFIQENPLPAPENDSNSNDMRF